MSSNNRRGGRLRAATAVGAAALTVLVLPPVEAAVDLASLHVTPQRGQSAEQARRDRYECHNWAVEQTGVVPRAQPADDEKIDTDRAKRADRAARAIAGAAIGGVLGSILGTTRDRHHRDADSAVLAGAAVGAAVGAATAKDASARKSTGAESPDENYLRALSACLEGRGYAVSLPDR
jgi:hypothetical protein